MQAVDIFNLPIGNDFSRLLTREKGFVTFDTMPQRRVHCVTQRISANTITIISPMRSSGGCTLTIELTGFGKFRGRVTRAIGGVLMIDLMMDDLVRHRLRKKVEWLERKRVLDLRERRRFPRWAPALPLSTLMDASGFVVPCFVVDVSSGGAAIASSEPPRIGEVVALGRIVGKVKRHVEDGFTIEFCKPVPAREVERLIAPVEIPVSNVALV